MRIEKLRQADEQEQHALKELDRRGFLLKTLCDATRELCGLEVPSYSGFILGGSLSMPACTR